MERLKITSLEGMTITEIKDGPRGSFEIWGRKSPLKQAVKLAIVDKDNFFDGDGNYFENDIE